MSVQSLVFSVSYAADGIQSAFAVPFYFFAFADLVVSVTPAGGAAAVVPMGNAGWEGSGAPDKYGAYPDGGEVTFQPGAIPAAGATVTIVRATARIQPDEYPVYGALPSTIIEHDFDRLTLIAQETQGGFIGVMPAPPATGLPGQWFILTPSTAGQPWAMVCTSGAPNVVWSPFAGIGL